MDEIITLVMECICDKYCKCRGNECREDDTPCFLEEDIKIILKNKISTED